MDHNELVARNIRRLRRERGFTIGELSRRSGLSKQTLSKVEQGDGNPTVDTLSALGEALDVSPRQLLTEWGSTVYVQRQADEAWQEHHGRSERILDRTYGSGYVHTLVMRLERGRPCPPVPAHSLGTLHHVYVITGKLRTGPIEDQVELSAGDFVRFPGDVPYQHTCLSERVVAHIVTTVPQVHQYGTADLGG
jgi:transcriptional regulator with XRE-family HTH domain